MSTTIDQRVVEMRFDNKQFENNAAASISTLAKLKDSLNLTGASKGLENINSAAKKVDFSQLEYAATKAGFQIQDIWLKTASILEYQVAGRIVQAGKTMAKALTIDPIKSGFSEYETQINAVQTILANTESKGTTLDDVNLALDTLNKYADKTIYNFTEMTRNIGTFTAAGVDLDTSVSSIQGIANLAAVSGSTSQQASTAMYQLSQALAAGTVKLQDWNSVVNAGMGGQVFQDALKRTAKAMGTDVDALIEKYGSFRESLTKGEWLTTDVLTETLNQFTMAAEEGSEEWENFKKSLKEKGYTEEQAVSILKMANTATDAATKVKTATQLWDTLKEAAQSGWTQTWEIIVGDFEEAKSLWTGVSDTIGEMINSSAESRNNMLEGAMTSNWDKMITKINEAGVSTTVFEEKVRSITDSKKINLDKLIEDHGSLEQAFRSGALSSDILKEAIGGLSTSLTDLSSIERELKKGMNGDDVKKAQEALLNLGYDLKEFGADGKFGSVTEAAVKAFQEANKLEVTGIIDEATIDALEKAGKSADGLSDSVSGLIDGIDKLGGRELLIDSLKNAFEGIMGLIKPIKEAFTEIFPPVTSEQLYKLIEGIHELSEQFVAISMIGGAKTTVGRLKRTFKGLFAAVDIVRQAFVGVIKLVSPLFGGLDDLGGGILGVTASWGDWLVNLNESIKQGDLFGKAVEKIHDAFKKIVEFLEPIGERIKEFANNIGDAFSGIAEKAEIRFEPLKALGGILIGVFGSLLKLIGSISPWIASAISGIGSLFSSLMDAISSSIQNTNYDAVFDVISGGIMSAIGIFIAKFMKSGSDILDNAASFTEQLHDIFEGVSDTLGAFTDSIKADTLKKIAVAIAILAASLLVLSLIDSDKLALSLITISTLFGELMGSMAIFGKITDGSGFKGIAKVTVAMISLAASLLILSIALKIMSTMSWEEMGVGLISLTVGLGSLVAAVNLLPDGKVKKAAKAIKTMASAMVILAIAIKIMGSMSWEEMGRGLITMVFGLGALVGAMHLLPKGFALKTTAICMAALAASMVILAAALKIMATMSWDEIGRSLAVLAGSLLILAGAMALMKKAIPGAAAMLIVAPALVVLAGALKIMATMSWDEIARGLVALGGSLVIIAGAMALMKKALPGAAALLVVTASLAVLAPVLKLLGSMTWGEIARGLVAIAGAFAIIGVAGLVLGPLVPVILSLSGAIALLGLGCVAIGAGVLMVGAGIAALATALAAGGGAIVVFITSLIGLIPFIIEQIGVGIIKFCEAIAGGAAAICEAITVVVLAVVDALVATIPAIAEGAFKLIVGLLEILIEYVPQLIPLLVDLLVKILDGIVGYLPVVIPTIFKFIGAIFDNIATNLTMLTDPLVKLFGSIFQFIADTIGPIIESVIAPLLSELVDLVVGCVEALAPYTPLICAAIVTITKVISDAIVTIVETIAPYIPELTRLVETIVNAFVSIVEQISPIIDSISMLLETLGTAITEILGGVGDVIVSFGDAVRSGLEGVASIFESAFGGIADIINSVGDTIKKFLDGIAGIIEAVGEAALNAGTGFDRLASGVETITNLKLADMVASLGAVANGIKDIASHSDGLGTVGTSMQQITGGLSSSASSFVIISNGLQTIVTSLSTIGPIAATSMSQLVDSVISSATCFNVLSTTAKVATTSIITSFTTCADSVSGIQHNFVSVGMKIVNSITSGIMSTQGKLRSTVLSIVDSSIKMITSKISVFRNSGADLINALSQGMKSKSVTLKSAVRVIVSAAANSISVYYGTFYSIGSYLVDGFASGISASSWKAEAQAAAMASAAYEAAKEALDVNSPSKIFRKLGYSIPEGLALGIDKLSGMAGKSAVSMSNNTIDTVKNSISRIADIVNSDIDTQPTIRPVLDLSDVKSGADSISGMFGFGTSVGVMANVGVIASSMRQQNQNGANDDVVSAIDKLRGDLSNVGGTQYVIDGITYDDGSNISDAVKSLVRAAKVQRRI